jgi:cobalt transporter subunit CbtA
MIQRMVTSACVAGIAAGLLAALLHFAFVQKYILLGETYESGAAVHFDGVLAGGHDHDAGSQEHDHAAHDHAAHELGAAGETSPLQRNGMTVLFFALLYAAYGLILVAGFGLAQHFGQRISAREGVLWGIAGFVAIQLAPAIGLAPELPGTVGPDLTDRQVWWAATVACTAAGLALIGYGRKPVWVALAVLILALPHVFGAPELDGFTGVAPPEVASAFAARSLAVGLAAWSLMGWLAGWMWDRDAVR